MTHISRVIRGACLCALLAGAASGCKPAPPKAKEQPPSVKVSRPVRKEVTDFEEFTGRTAAVQAVQVRARVSGYLERIHFNDGDEVKKGHVLYEIDPRPYQDALAQAQAQVSLQEAQLQYQETLHARNTRLLGQAAVSQEEYQQSLASRNTSRAQVEAAKAAVETAKLNLEWTKVTAPIDGLLGRTLLTPGNLVVADQTLLTTIVSQDPIYVYFDADEYTSLRVRDLIRAGELPYLHSESTKIPVLVGLATEEGFPHEGYLDFANNQFEASTATIRLRGVIKNPQPKVGPRLFAPAMFVRVRVAVSPPHTALLVSQGAVGTDLDRKFVYVLDEHDRVVRREVQLGSVHDGLQEIVKGVTADDRVIIEGLQHVRPGTTVAPRLVEMPVPRTDDLPQTPPAVLKSPPEGRGKK